MKDDLGDQPCIDQVVSLQNVCGIDNRHYGGRDFRNQPVLAWFDKSDYTSQVAHSPLHISGLDSLWGLFGYRSVLSRARLMQPWTTLPFLPTLNLPKCMVTEQWKILTFLATLTWRLGFTHFPLPFSFHFILINRSCAVVCPQISKMRPLASVIFWQETLECEFILP